jgi:foldase protein PrsA
VKKRFNTITILLLFIISIILTNVIIADPIEKIVANVNGSGILLSELKEYAKPYIEMGIIKDNDSGYKQILDVMIDEELILQICEENNIKISKDYVNEIIETIKTKLKSDDTELVKKYLNVPTDFILRRRIRIDTCMLSMIRKLYSGNELSFYVKIPTDDDVINRYNEDYEKYKPQEEREIHHILISYIDNQEDKQRANELIKNIWTAIKNNKADFKQMAEKYSQDYNTKDDGGNLGYFRKYELREFSEEYEKYAFSISKNDISPIIEIENAYAIIMVSDIEKSDEINLSEVSDEIYLNLLEENFYNAFGPYFDMYKKDSYINIIL